MKTVLLIILLCSLSLAKGQGIQQGCVTDINCIYGYNWRIERNSIVNLLMLHPDKDATDDGINEPPIAGVDDIQSGTGVFLNSNNLPNQQGKYYLLTAAHVFRAKPFFTDDPKYQDQFYELPRAIVLTVNQQRQYCNHDIASRHMFQYVFYIQGHRNPTTNLRYRVLTEGDGWYRFDGDIPERDYILIELDFNGQPDFLQQSGVCFTGWDANSGIINDDLTNIVRISHPLVQNEPAVWKKIDIQSFSNNIQPNSNLLLTDNFNLFETGWTGPGASGCGVWGRLNNNNKTKLIGHHIKTSLFNSICIDDFGNKPGLASTAIRFSYIWNDGRLWRYLDQNQDKNAKSIDSYCPPEPDCFDNKQNQGEDHVDCCDPPPNGCTVCPPCVPPLGNGGNNSSCRVIFSEDFDLLQNCYNGTNSFPQVRFRINSNCLANMCLAWKESGQQTPTGDINPIPQRVDIGERGQIRELTYTWDFHGGLPPSFPITKTYTLYVYDFGCTGEPYTQIDFPITIYGSAVVNAGNDLSLCVNQTEQLNGQFQGGNYYTNAFWRAMPSQAISYLSNPNIVNPTLTPTQTGTYTYTLEIRDGMNCSGFDEIIVRVDHITRPAELRLGCVVPPDYYHAGRIYTAETCSTTITAPEPTDLVGAQEVNLLPGFTASAGATFTARIAPCDVDENAQAPPPEPRTAQKAVEKTDLKPNSFSYDLFPNPTDGTFTLRYTSTDARLVNVRLYDNIGRLLTETSWHDQNRDFEIDVSRYSAGLYHIYVSDGRQTVVKKLFKR